MAVSSTGVRFDFLGRDVSASRTAQGVERRFEGLGRTAVSTGRVVATGLAGMAAGGALFGKSMLDAAVKVEAMGNKARTVFGRDFPKAERAADRLNEKLGMTTTETEGLLAGFGDLLIPMGFTTKRATDLSIQFGDLTAALTQWSGGTRTAAEVQDILGDALTGEYDSLKSLGVQIDAATVKELLHRQGKDKLTGAALKQAEAEVALAEITRQSASAIQSYEDGTNKLGLAKQSLTATGKQLREEIALRLTPAFATAGEWLVRTGVPRLRMFGATIRDDVIPRVRDAWDALSERAPDIDWSPIGRSLQESAASWGGRLLTGLQSGLDTGNWRPLGETLGRGLVRAVDSLATKSSEIAGAVRRWAGSVDWFAVGMDVGKTAAPFAVGFMSQLGSGLVRAAKEHPVDFAVGIASFFGAGKIAGIISKVLSRIPGLRVLARPLISILTKWDEFTAPVNNAVWRFVRSIGRGFVSAFSRAFPGVARDLGRHVRGLADDIGARALYAQEAAFKFASGIGPGIGRALGSVTIAVGRIIWRLTFPFRTAGGWLIGRGSDLVRGLLRGIAGTSVGQTVGRVISRVTMPFRGAAGWLFGAGRNVIGGLLGGIASRMAGVGGWIKSVVVDPIIGAVKRFFGIKSPSRVMMGIGGHLITGLVQGMVRQNPTAIAGKVFGGMPAALGAIVGKGLVSIRNLPGRALKALSGLGGKFAGLLDGIGGFLGGRGGGNASGLVAFGRWLQAMGYSVTEHPAFGGVTPGAHVKGSQHYIGQAIDVNKGAGTSRAEQRELAKIIGPAHQAGFRTIFMAPGHYNHAHIAMAGGGVIGEPVFGVGARSGRSYSFGENGDETVIPGVPRAVRGGGDVHIHLHGVVAGSKLALENALVAAYDSAKGKGRIR